MLYLGTSPGNPAVDLLLRQRRIGMICQPGSNRPGDAWAWAADNGCFSARWQADKWERWLDSDENPRSTCLWATVPDVVGNAAATVERFDRYAGIVRAAGFPVAFVAQNGQLPELVPWDDLDAIFVGGTTECRPCGLLYPGADLRRRPRCTECHRLISDWKLSEDAHGLAQLARAAGKAVHVGRVNSGKRFHGWSADADTADGSFLAVAPTENAGRLLRWIEQHEASPQLWP